MTWQYMNTLALTADTLLAKVTNWLRTVGSHSRSRKSHGFTTPPTPSAPAPRPESRRDDPRFGEDWEEGRKDWWLLTSLVIYTHKPPPDTHSVGRK